MKTQSMGTMAMAMAMALSGVGTLEAAGPGAPVGLVAGRAHGLVAARACRDRADRSCAGCCARPRLSTPHDADRCLPPRQHIVTGARVIFRDVAGRRVFVFRTVIVQAASGAGSKDDGLRPVAPATVDLGSRRRPSNYWTGAIPAGLYRVTIRHPRYRTYHHPRPVLVRPAPARTRLDFRGLIPRCHRDRDTAGDVVADVTEGPAAPAIDFDDLLAVDGPVRGSIDLAPTPSRDEPASPAGD